MSQLVSVPVLTYNSSEFIEETLESIYHQTYQNIELIISDDCSKDNTVKIVEKWCNQPIVQARFTDIKIITVPENTGIPGNYNRCVKACDGEWIKMIAGDDVLLPNCISDNLSHIKNNPEVRVLFSYNRVYKNDFREENFITLNPKQYPKNIISPTSKAKDQYEILLEGNRISFTPSSFFSRESILKVGLIDEDLYSEDYQLFLKFTKEGYPLSFMEKETVLYRQHDKATNNTIQQYILKPHYFKTESFRRRYIYPNISTISMLEQKFAWRVNQLFKIENFNKQNSLNKMIYYLLNSILNPFKYISFITSKISNK